MANRCPVCEEVIPPESLSRLQQPGFTIYVYEKDKKGNVVIREHQTKTVCSKDCLVESMESASRKIPKGEEYRIWIVLNTNNPGEILASFARQLRAFG